MGAGGEGGGTRDVTPLLLRGVPPATGKHTAFD
jgi:hypothetical protein